MDKRKRIEERAITEHIKSQIKKGEDSRDRKWQDNIDNVRKMPALPTRTPVLRHNDLTTTEGEYCQWV